MYILTAQHFDTRFLESYGSRPEQVKIVNFREEKLIIINVTRKVIFVSDDKGEHSKAVDITVQLPKANDFCDFPVFTFLYNGEIVCSKGKGQSKLNIYNINEENSCLEKTTTIPIKHVVEAIAFNHQSDELIILCRTLLLYEYYLLIYTKNGELEPVPKFHPYDYHFRHYHFRHQFVYIKKFKYHIVCALQNPPGGS